MKNRNVILCCVNAQPTAGHSRREFVPLISHSQQQHAETHQQTGESPPIPSTPETDAENLPSRHSSKPK